MEKKQHPINTKEAVRKELVARRKNISCARKNAASNAAFETLIRVSAPYKLVLSFSSLPEEINLLELNKKLAIEKKLVLPRVVGGELTLHAVSDLSKLKKGAFKIDQPSGAMPQLYIDEVCCIFVPGLGFDANNQRIGFGLGFYDKLLAQRSHKTKLYGIGFKEQKTDILLPTDKHDIPVDELLLF